MPVLILGNDTSNQLLPAIFLKFQEVFALWFNKAKNDKNNSLLNLLCQLYKSLLLQQKITLTTLDLSDINFGAEGAKVFAEALKTNTTLTALYLNNNNIGAEILAKINEYLERNKRLKEAIDALKSEKTIPYLKPANIGAKGKTSLKRVKF